MGKFQLLAGNVIHFMRIIGTVEKNDIIDLSVCCVYGICISVGTESAITCCMVIEFYEIVVTEELKSTDMMLWVQKMNNTRNRATEIANADLIYT